MKKKKLLILSSLVLGSLILTTSCGIKLALDKDNQKTQVASALDKSSKFIDLNTKVKYVALGDSITAGFDGTLPQDYPGELKNNEVTGSSYAAFLAKILQDQNRLDDFKNYAISGATTFQFMRLLGVIYSKPNDSNINIFGKTQAEQQSLASELKNKLKDANLVTLTLGANDFFDLLFFEIQNSNLNENSIKQAILDSKGNNNLIFTNLFKNIIIEIKARLNAFLATLKTLAPRANINLVSYPMPLLRLKETLDAYLKQYFGNLDFSVLESLTTSINSLLKSLATPEKEIYYVDVFNSDYWIKNADELSTIFFDIHPNYKGYKKMAMDIYLKITRSAKVNLDNLSKYDFNFDYLNDDSKTLKYQLEVSQDSAEIFGESSEEFLNKNDDLTSFVKSKVDTSNFGKRIVALSQIFNFITNKALDVFLTSDIYKNLDPQGKLKALLNKAPESASDKSNKEKFLEFLYDSNLIPNSISNLQNNLEKARSEKIKIDFPFLISQVSKSLFSQNNLFSLLKSLLTSEFLNDNLNELKDIFLTIAGNLTKGELTANLASFVFDTKDKTVANLINANLKSALETKGMADAIKLILDRLFNNAELFKTSTDFKDLLQKMFADETFKDEFTKAVVSITKSLVGNSDLIQLDANALIKLLNTNPEQNLLKGIDSAKQVLLVINLIRFIALDSNFEELVKSSFEIFLNNDLELKFDSNFILKFFKYYLQDTTKIFELIKNLFKSNLYTQNKTELKQVLISVFDLLKNNDKFFESVFDSTNLKEKLFGKENLLKDLFKIVLNSDEFESLKTDLIENLFETNGDDSRFDSWNDFFKSLFNLDKKDNNLTAKLNNLQKFLTNNEAFKSKLGELIYAILFNDADTKVLFKGINNPQEFLTKVLSIFLETIQPDFFKNTLNNLFNSNFWNDLLAGNNLKKIFSSVVRVQGNSNVIRLFAAIASDSKFSEIKSDLKTFTINLLNVYKTSISKFVVEVFINNEEEAKTLETSENQQDQTTQENQEESPSVLGRFFDNKVLSSLLNQESFKFVASDLFDFFVDNAESLKNANGFSDLLVAYFKALSVAKAKAELLNTQVSTALSTFNITSEDKIKSVAKLLNSTSENNSENSQTPSVADKDAAKLYQNLLTWFNDAFSSTNVDLVEFVAKSFFDLLKEQNINFEDNQENKDLFKNLSTSLLKSLVSNQLIKQILDSLIDNVTSEFATKAQDKTSEAQSSSKNNLVLFVDDSEAVGKARETQRLAKFQKVFKKSLFAIVKNDQGQFSFTKMISLTGFIQSFISDFGALNFAKFVNLLFDSSDFAKTQGVYEYIAPYFRKYNPSVTENATTAAATSSSLSDFSFDISIFNLKKIEDSIKALFKSLNSTLLSEYIKQVQDGSITTENQKQNPVFRAMFRINTLIVWLIARKAPFASLWWYGLLPSIRKSFNELINEEENRKNIDSLGETKENKKLKLLGLDSSKTQTDLNFIFGNTGSVYDWNMPSDAIVAYMYYETDSKVDPHNSEKKIYQTIWDAIVKGYAGELNQYQGQNLK
ncbi:SGNH/GDSL hydrolase family protein [Mycoplasmopsis synoviae]|uniref:SGNH/GDSL hydrolase family protein n=1 Tax=Mycoplasmopsis synoviae TaxID=2109 RepID=UPI003564C612